MAFIPRPKVQSICKALQEVHIAGTTKPLSPRSPIRSSNCRIGKNPASEEIYASLA